MAQTRRTGFTDAALVRLLSPVLAPAQPAQPARPARPGRPAPIPERLLGWLRWTDAPPLYAALHEPISVPPLADDEDASAGSAQADAQSVHALLQRAIREDTPWQQRPPARPRPGSGWLPAAAAPALDWPAYRRHCQDRQWDMAERIAPLRARLRRVLQLQSPALARLAALDEVMERVLAEPEHRLLGQLPARLQARHAHWRAQCTDADPDHPDAAWHADFQRELEHWLLAELDLRWQPIAALLAALQEHLDLNHTPT